MDFDTVTADVNKILTTHFTSGRGGKGVEMVVVHCETPRSRRWRGCSACGSPDRLGPLPGGERWPRRPARLEAARPGHNGDFSDKTDAPSGSSTPSSSDGTITSSASSSGAHLVAALCREYGLGRPEWLVNVFPHKHFYRRLPAPGPVYGSQKDAYIARARR